MQIFQCHNHLVYVALYLHLHEPSPPLYQVVETLVAAELEQNVDVLGILKHMFEVHNIGVVQRSVDLDLRKQLGPLPALLKGYLGDDLCRKDLLGLQIGALVALGETSFPEELAPSVAFDYRLAQ